MTLNKQQRLQDATNSSNKSWRDVAELKKELRESERACATLSQDVEKLVEVGKSTERAIEQTKRDIATWAQNRKPPHEKLKRARQVLRQAEGQLEDSNKVLQVNRHELQRLGKARDGLRQKIHRTESQARENDKTISQITAELEREQRQAAHARAQQAARTKPHHSNQQPASGHVPSSHSKVVKPAKAPSHPTPGHSSKPPGQPAKLKPQPAKPPVHQSSGHARSSKAVPSARPPIPQSAKPPAHPSSGYPPASRAAPQPRKPVPQPVRPTHSHPQPVKPTHSHLQPVKHSAHHASNHVQPFKPAFNPVKPTGPPPADYSQTSSLVSKLFKRYH